MTNRPTGRPSKLTPEQLSSIASLSKNGKNYLAIAKELGINKGSVWWLVIGKNRGRENATT